MTPERHDFLDLGDMGQVFTMLDDLYARGGLPEVATWVETELQPGRAIRYRRGDGEVEERVIATSSLSRLDRAGAPEDEELAGADTSHWSADAELFAVWSRPLVAEPFQVTVTTRKKGQHDAG